MGNKRSIGIDFSNVWDIDIVKAVYFTNYLKSTFRKFETIYDLL